MVSPLENLERWGYIHCERKVFKKSFSQYHAVFLKMQDPIPSLLNCRR